jgi:hypothetical protein
MSPIATRDLTVHERTAPRSDPTNPYAQEATGITETGRRENERAVAEPGLTKRDREERGHAWASDPRASR